VCNISVCRITGPTIYNDAVNATRNANNFLSPFFTQLTEEERLCYVFQQDSATAHMAYISLEALQEVYGNYTISHDL
jgi:hypothetical protein